MHMASLTLLQGTVPIEGVLRLVPPEPSTTVDVAGLLAPHEGREVQLLAYHFPLGGLDPAKPGGGSCLWDTGRCPYHTLTPTSLYTVKARGVLHRRFDGEWVVDGTLMRLDMLRGHHAGMVLFLVPDVTATPAAVTSEDMSGLSSYMGQVQELLALVRARQNGRG